MTEPVKGVTFVVSEIPMLRRCSAYLENVHPTSPPLAYTSLFYRISLERVQGCVSQLKGILLMNRSAILARYKYLNAK